MKPYSIDPVQISLDEFRLLCAGRKMLPARVILQEAMEERFSALKDAGITNLGNLIKQLGSASKIEAFSARCGLSKDYLVILKREAGSYLAKPFLLSKFPGIPFEYVELMKSKGIKSTRDFFEKLQSEQDQADFSIISGIPAYRLSEIYALCDLSRITGVGGIFARILYEAGILSVEECATTAAAAQLKSCRAVIDKYGYPAGNLGEEDILYGIHYARVVLACDNKLT